MPRPWRTSIGRGPWVRTMRSSPPGAASPWRAWGGTTRPMRPSPRRSRAEADRLPAPTRARLAWAYGFAISARDADRARKAFDDALRFDPRNAQAFYGRAMIAMGRGEDAGALRDFDRAIEADPGRNEARRYRAILLARQGDWKSATLRDQPMPSTRAPVFGDALRRRLRRRQGLRRLRHHRDRRPVARPPRAGPGRGRRPRQAAEDPDLVAIRRLPRFRRLAGRSQGSGAASRRCSISHHHVKPAILSGV